MFAVKFGTFFKIPLKICFLIGIGTNNQLQPFKGVS